MKFFLQELFKNCTNITKLTFSKITPGLSGFYDQSKTNSALYSAFSSVEHTDSKIVIVENIPPALFEDAEVAEGKQPQNLKRRKFY